MRKLAQLATVTAVAAGALVGVAAPAQAHPLDVIVVENGAPCPSGYGEIAQIDKTTLCWHVRTLIPEYRLVTDGAPCPTYPYPYTEYSVINYVRVCLYWYHQ